MDRRYRLFILGAGFSSSASLPLAPELWNEVQRRAMRLTGRASSFERDLEAYITFKRECHRVDIQFDQVDFEDFLAFLDIEHHLGLRGSDTWSEDGNEGQVVVKTLIGEILAERMPRPDDIPPLYLSFAETLQPNDIVLTFNYDILLERALQVVKKPFRLFPNRYREIHSTGAIVDTSRDEVILLKLHGSIDWFNRRQYRTLEENFRRSGLTTSPRHPVFNNMAALGARRVVEGPRFDDDPLRDMYRFENIESLYGLDILFMATPWLLNPSMAKILHYEKLREFWFGLGGAGILNFGLAIIGYSLPPADVHAERIIYQLVKNYQEEHWNEEIFGQRKTPLVLVDLRRTDAEKEDYRKRYGFVDWSRARLILTGFDTGVIPLFE